MFERTVRIFQPPQFRLDARLARLLSLPSGTRQTIIHALWQYIKSNKLQDSDEREFINCDTHLQSVSSIDFEHRSILGSCASMVSNCLFEYE
jgi:chromatin remodeling complex protein RSC6